MNTVTKKSRARGFTLIEILIVIGIIAILAAIVLVAVNPAKQFREAANTQRISNLNATLNAVGQYIVDNKGAIPNQIQADWDTIGSDDLGNDDDYADLCKDGTKPIVPNYIAALPADPNEADQSITEDDCSGNYTTGYEIRENGGRIEIRAPQTIDVATGNDSLPENEMLSVIR